MAKISLEQRAEIAEAIRTGSETSVSLARRMGVSRQYISIIKLEAGLPPTTLPNRWDRGIIKPQPAVFEGVPERQKMMARRIINTAIRAGRVTRLPCEKCGEKKVHAHHDDYSKPLDVRWLCSKHHAEHHAALNASMKPIPEPKPAPAPKLKDNQCDKCATDNSVIDSRANSARNEIRRRRLCNACGRRWTTYEIESDSSPSRTQPPTVDALHTLDKYRVVMQRILSFIPPQEVAWLGDPSMVEVLRDAKLHQPAASEQTDRNLA